MKRMYLLLAVFLLPIFLSQNVSALDACSQSDSQVPFDAIAQLTTGPGKAYVRLNRAGQFATASLASKDIESSACTLVGTTQASSESWTYIGELTVKPGNSITQLAVILDDPQASQGASSPSVLFVPSSSLPCDDVNNCTALFGNKMYELSPRKVSLNSDTLRVAQLITVDATDKVKKTIFYIDGKLLYTVNGTQSGIDRRYIGSGEHEIKTSYILQSGQVLSSVEKVDLPFSIDKFIMPLVLKNKETFKTVLLGLAFLVGYVLVIGLLNKLKAYLKWRKTHIVSKSTTPTTAQLSSVEMYKKLQGTELRRKDTKLLVLSLTVPLVVIIIVIVASQFLIGTFKVDGVSMETTLHDKSTQWMYKLPVSLAKFNNGNVALNRGDVVVLHHDDNNLFVPEVETKKSYVVKRVIGLPGERIKVADGSITVFNKLTPPGINPDKGVSWEPVIAPSSGISIDITLKEGELFVVGDDREYSIDSRYYGPVKSTDVVGIVLYKHKQGLVPYKEQ